MLDKTPTNAGTANGNDQGSSQDNGSGNAGSDGSGAGTVSFDTFIPEEFKSKDYVQAALKKENPVAEILNMYDNAQKLIGQKANEYRVPAENASADELAKFNKMIGVPDSVEGYESPAIEWKPEEKEAAEVLQKTLNADLMKALKAEAYKAGLSAKQWKILEEGYNRSFVTVHGQQLQELAKAQQEITEDFSRESEALFGADVDKVLKNVGGLVEKYASKSKPHLVDMPNKYLLMMAEVLEGVRKDYIKQDTFVASPQVVASQFDLTTVDGVHKAAQELRKDPAFVDFKHKDHAAAVKRVQDMYDLIPKISAK